jgi:hypothetical protein
MTDELPRPLGRDDQPTDAGDDALNGLPPDEADTSRTVGDAGDADSGLLPPVVEFEDHERVDLDDAAKPGIDDDET